MEKSLAPAVAIAVVACALLAAQADEPRFGRGPWIFEQRGTSASTPLTIRYNGRLSSPARIQLDGATVATLSVTPAPCGQGRECEPADCGCHGVDRFLLSIVQTNGTEVARTHLWAAYGTFDVVPLDLVDGPGDELMIVRVLGRSAPPNGHDLKILKVAAGRLVDLVEPVRIAGNLSGTPMVCGQWRSRVAVDGQARKPRPLWIRNEVIVPDGCRLDAAGRANTLRKEHRQLVFTAGRYQPR